jgi:hypothetical protein
LQLREPAASAVLGRFDPLAVRKGAVNYFISLLRIYQGVDMDHEWFRQHR